MIIKRKGYDKNELVHSYHDYRADKNVYIKIYTNLE